MKIAISAVGNDVSSKVDPRFGRAKMFMVFDSDTGDWSVLENATRMDLPQGAGIQTAQMIARSGVDGVITGHCGPKAWQVLSGANLSIYFVGSRTVGEAAEEFKNGKLKATDGADVQGHW